jgi:hypothetical protein
VAAGDIGPVPGGRERDTRAGTMELAIPEAAVRVVLPVVLGAPAGRSGRWPGCGDQLPAAGLDPAGGEACRLVGCQNSCRISDLDFYPRQSCSCASPICSWFVCSAGWRCSPAATPPKTRRSWCCGTRSRSCAVRSPLPSRTGPTVRVIAALARVLPPHLPATEAPPGGVQVRQGLLEYHGRYPHRARPAPGGLGRGQPRRQVRPSRSNASTSNTATGPA